MMVSTCDLQIPDTAFSLFLFFACFCASRTIVATVVFLLLLSLVRVSVSNIASSVLLVVNSLNAVSASPILDAALYSWDN